MEILSKVHSQPRLLTRSSWWIPLMLLLACSIAHGSFTDRDIDQWMEEYSKKSYDWTKRKFIRKILKKVINYDKLYIKHYKTRKTDKEKCDYMKDVLNQFKGRGLCNDAKIREWMGEYDKKGNNKLANCMNGKLKYFREIVKKNLDYEKIINKWNTLTDESKPTRDDYLRDWFETLVDRNLDHTQAYTPPQPDGDIRTIMMKIPDSKDLNLIIKDAEAARSHAAAEQFEQDSESHGMPGVTHRAKEDEVQYAAHPEEKLPTPLVPVQTSDGSTPNPCAHSHKKERSDALEKLYSYAGFTVDTSNNAGNAMDLYKTTLQTIIDDWHHRSFPIWRMLQLFHDKECSFYYDVDSKSVLDSMTKNLINEVDSESPKRWPELYEIPKLIVKLESEKRLAGQTLFTDDSLYMVALDLGHQLGYCISEIHMARAIELLIINDRGRPFSGKMPVFHDSNVGETDLKNLLYERFKNVAHEWIQRINGRTIIQYMMPRKSQKCEQCGKKDGLGLLSNLFSSSNCKTCGRLLCKNCFCSKDGKRCCKDGEGCQVYLKDSHPTSQSDPEPLGQQADALKQMFQEIREQVATKVDVTSNQVARRSLGEKISDSAFWEGVLTSLLVLFLSFFAHYFLFTTPEVPPSRRKTVHIKKKRSTFFKTKNPEKAQTASQVKGAFSSVIRRQLSKLDEN